MKWEGANGAMVLGQMIFYRDRIEYGYINQIQYILAHICDLKIAFLNDFDISLTYLSLF